MVLKTLKMPNSLYIGRIYPTLAIKGLNASLQSFGAELKEEIQLSGVSWCFIDGTPGSVALSVAQSHAGWHSVVLFSC